MTRRRACRGFSLVELLVTAALIIVVAVMVNGRGSGGFQSRQKAACRENLQTLHVALQLFANDHEGRFPFVTNAASSEDPLSLLTPGYISTTEPFVCPGTKRSRIPEGRAIARYGISYACYMGRTSADTSSPLLSDAQVNVSEKAAGDPLFSQDGDGAGNNHHQYGGNLLRADGSVFQSGARASEPLKTGPGVRLLNPK